MTIRYYLVPIETVGEARGPKYLRWRFTENPTPLGVTWSGMDFGLEPAMLVRADVTGGQHTTLSANADVVSIPTNIDANITADALPTVKAALETLNIPADWVTTAFTYRQVLRMVAGLFQFAQRHHGIHFERLFSFNMDTQFSSLPLPVRQRLIATANSLNYDISGLSGSNTIRQILKDVADQWGDKPIILGGVEI
jgi:hypothetical protein